ncbi:THxN family PEP-CTERM protein [Almyronema epifaneia]|uniref:THxN family PEP-CTERM protein n=1 Tax=Almyronema epifaneia S1 TaxID=2991925 RepID=A0ABW6IBR6_9CYAN
MKLQHFTTSTLPVVAIATLLGVASAPANAQTLAIGSTSGSWSNPNGGTAIQYLTDGDEAQIRWGNPATGYATAGKSGLGFEGIGPSEITVGENFLLGTLSHYNLTIWSGTAADAADLSLNLDLGEAGNQQFDFTLNIDETLNLTSTQKRNGSQCPYITTTFGCSDSITWENPIEDAFMENVFQMAGKEYKLQLIGFSDTIDGEPVEQFISQEGGVSRTNLFARIIQVSPENQDVPEPTAMLGLGLFGLYAASNVRRRKLAASE